MNFISDLQLVQGKNELLVYIDKFSKLCRFISIFLGKGELSAKQVASILFDTIARLFGVPTNIVYDRDIHFTA